MFLFFSLNTRPCIFQTLKSNITMHFLPSQFTTSTTITWFCPSRSPADLSVACNHATPPAMVALFTDLWVSVSLWIELMLSENVSHFLRMTKSQKDTSSIFTLLLADFAIKAGESDGKGLYGTQRIPIVQSEGIVCYSPKLHHNVVLWNVAQKRVMQWHICLANIPVLTPINILHVFYNINCSYFTAYIALCTITITNSETVCKISVWNIFKYDIQIFCIFIFTFDG